MHREYRIAGSMAVWESQPSFPEPRSALSGPDPASASRDHALGLVNPWASFYELNSTHPLTAFRVRALNEQAEKSQAIGAHETKSGSSTSRWSMRA